MARKLSFVLEIDGGQQLVSNLSKVELSLSSIGKEMSRVKKQIDILNNGSKEQREELEKQGITVAGLEQEYESLRTQQLGLQKEGKDLRRELKEQEKAFDLVKNAVPEDSLIGLRAEYRKLRKELDLLGKEALGTAENIEKLERADRLKRQIDSYGESVSDFRSQVGSYKTSLLEVFNTLKSGSGGIGLDNIIDPLGNIFGGGITGGLGGIEEITNLLGPYGIAANIAVSATAQLVGTVADVTLEYEKYYKIVGDLTQLQGQQQREAVIGVKTIADTFDKEFNEVLIAANTLTKEVTGDFNESIKLIEQGFLAGADANGEFLDSIREYSTQIRAAGASGEEFIEILVRAQQEGIYSDKGIDLVKEFGLRIREQTTATKEALEDAFGEEFTTELFNGINDGSITTVEALTNVSQALEDQQLTAKQSQQILADVFGGPGEDAGLRFIKILSEVDGNLDDLIDNADAYTRRLIDNLDATRSLNTEQERLAAQFAGTGISVQNLGKRLKTGLLDILNDGIETVRTYKQIFDREGFFGFLASSQADYFANLALLRKADSDALNEQKEGEEELAKSRRQSAIEGSLTIQELIQQQQLLKQEIDEARKSGDDYLELLDQYNVVTRNIARAQAVFNSNVEKTRQDFERAAADGSIELLRKKVADLNAEINKTPTNATLELLEQLNQAELDLSEAERELQEFRDQVREANIDSLPIEEQVKLQIESINKRRELEKLYARERIEDIVKLNEEISKITIRSEIDSLNVKLQEFKEGSEEFLTIVNQINQKQDELDSLNIQIQLTDAEQLGQQIDQQLIDTAQKITQSEEALQEQLEAIRLNRLIQTNQQRLNIEQLTSEQRIKLEQDTQDAINKLDETQASIDIDFIERLEELNRSRIESLQQLNEERLQLDLTDTSSLDRIAEIEQLRKQLILESDIEIADLRLTLLRQQGEDTLELESQILDKKIELNETKNKQLIDTTKETATRQQTIVRDSLKIQEKAVESIGNALGDFLFNVAEDQEEAGKKLVKSLANVIIDLVGQQLTVLATTAFAQTDSVASYGATGAIRVALITGLIQAAIQGLKGIFTNFEFGGITDYIFNDGGVPGSGYPFKQDLKKGTIFRGRKHSQGGEKFLIGSQLNEAQVNEAIIKDTATLKWRGLLAAINVDGGGKDFAPGESKHYIPFLNLIQGKQYNQGDITGTALVTAQPIPQLNNPNAVLVADARINPIDIETMAEALNRSIIASLMPIVEQTVNNVIIGLDESNRLKERQSDAESKGEL